MHDKIKSRQRREIPSVDKLLRALAESELPRSVLVRIVRRRLAALRAKQNIPEFSALLADLRSEIADLALIRMQPIINGTGIVIHTNFGRVPLAPSAIDAMRKVARGYNNLEYDLTTGGRGRRGFYLEELLALLCHAEAATVVNNCAAALLLILRHFVRGEKNEVIISRGELIQIGGGFRIPDILETSGAVLREVGTTNRTTLNDYAAACGKKTALILKVHRSNFFMVGFVESANTELLAALARRKRIPLVEDVGSGAMVGTEAFGLEHEPSAAESIKRGADLVCFSGDKLFGGPQAGIIAGKKRQVAALKREPFFRALRCDKLVLAALEATAELYLRGTTDDIPVLAILRLTTVELEKRAEKLCAQIRMDGFALSVGSGVAQIGGGALPRARIPSVTLDFSGSKVAELAVRLRRGKPPVVGHIASGKLKLDLRTIFPDQEQALVAALTEAARNL